MEGTTFPPFGQVVAALGVPRLLVRNPNKQEAVSIALREVRILDETTDVCAQLAATLAGAHSTMSTYPEEYFRDAFRLPGNQVLGIIQDSRPVAICIVCEWPIHTNTIIQSWMCSGWEQDLQNHLWGVCPLTDHGKIPKDKGGYPDGLISTLFVDPMHRGQGLGLAMVLASLYLLKQKGRRGALAVIDEGRERSAKRLLRFLDSGRRCKYATGRGDPRLAVEQIILRPSCG